jgi:outer membrane protein OmpA-like peptidoglycan-associated protein
MYKLIESGISPERMTAKGYGETKPVAANTKTDKTDNPQGRQLNRRVEFKITGI